VNNPRYYTSRMEIRGGDYSLFYRSVSDRPDKNKTGRPFSVGLMCDYCSDWWDFEVHDHDKGDVHNTCMNHIRYLPLATRAHAKMIKLAVQS
jgi:hypothetical protein